MGCRVGWERRAIGSPCAGEDRFGAIPGGILLLRADQSLYRITIRAELLVDIVGPRRGGGRKRQQIEPARQTGSVLAFARVRPPLPFSSPPTTPSAVRLANGRRASGWRLHLHVASAEQAAYISRRGPFAEARNIVSTAVGASGRSLGGGEGADGCHALWFVFPCVGLLVFFCREGWDWLIYHPVS